jgi:hypothetical protein
MIQNRDVERETRLGEELIALLEPKQPPAPVAWGDLRVGETYWVFCGMGLPKEITIDRMVTGTCFEPPREPGMCMGNLTIYDDQINEDSEGRPMIYAAPADAVDAMTIALRQWLEGVERG